MSLPRFEYVSPKTVARAVALQKDGGKFMAGGTDLLVAMKQRIKDPGLLIDLNAIAALKKIKRDKKNGLRVGALATLTQMKEDPIIRRHLPALGNIVPLVSTPQLQNMGTLGGNLCLDTRCYYYNQPVFLKKRWEHCLKIGGQVCHVLKGGDGCHAVYSGDMAAPLMALGTRVKVTGPESSTEFELYEFFSGSGTTPNILKSSEILTEILIPQPPKHSSLSYRKLRLRDTMDFPLLGVAAFLHLDGKNGACRDFRLVLSAVGPSPIIVDEASEIMRSQTITPKLIEQVSKLARNMAHPVANTASSPGYRRDMVQTLTKKAIHDALDSVKNAGG